MKQIRRNVFETNSSSTHSVSITRRSISEIIEDIANENKQESENEVTTSESFLIGYGENVILSIKGIESPDGDESKNVYHIINSWWVKLQLIGAFIHNNKTYINEYLVKYKEYLEKYFDGDSFKMCDYFRYDHVPVNKKDLKEYNKRKQEYSEIEKIFEETNVVKYFKKKCIGLYKRYNNIKLNDVVFSDEMYEPYWEYGEDKMLDVLKSDNVDDFKEMLENILDDEVNIISSDVAYNPYYQYEVSVL